MYFKFSGDLFKNGRAYILCESCVTISFAQFDMIKHKAFLFGLVYGEEKNKVRFYANLLSGIAKACFIDADRVIPIVLGPLLPKEKSCGQFDSKFLPAS